jgi:ferredoxin
MQIIIRQGESDIPCDVADGESIASAARRVGINLYGSCHGQGVCCQCSRRVIEGVASILNQHTGKPAIPDGWAPYALTCMTTPTKEDVIIDANRRARLT